MGILFWAFFWSNFNLEWGTMLLLVCGNHRMFESSDRTRHVDHGKAFFSSSEFFLRSFSRHSEIV